MQALSRGIINGIVAILLLSDYFLAFFVLFKSEDLVEGVGKKLHFPELWYRECSRFVLTNRNCSNPLVNGSHGERFPASRGLLTRWQAPRLVKCTQRGYHIKGR